MYGNSILSCCPRNNHGHKRILKEEEDVNFVVELEKRDLAFSVRTMQAL